MKEINVGDLLGWDNHVAVVVHDPEWIAAQAQFPSNRYAAIGLTVERARELRDKLVEYLKRVER